MIGTLGESGGSPLPEATQLDLSTCVNAYGPPDSARAALSDVGDRSLRLHPYEAASRVSTSYAVHLAVEANELVVGRGTTEFIWALARELRAHTVAVPRPAYSDFLRAFPEAAMPVNGPTVSTDAIASCMASHRATVISNPQNPSGTFIPVHDLLEVAQSYPTSLLVVDESYSDFLEGETRSLAGTPSDNIVVLASPSKFYGVASTRVGVAWTRDEGLRRALSEGRGPWPISGVDAEVARAVLADLDWATRIRKSLSRDAAWLEELLRRVAPVVAGSATHYRLIAGSPHLERLANALLAQGVRVRQLTTAHGFEIPALRIASPRADQREILEEALARVPDLRLVK